jgi:hypothetical protein
MRELRVFRVEFGVNISVGWVWREASCGCCLEKKKWMMLELLEGGLQTDSEGLTGASTRFVCT